ncbi:hypothetical protein BgiMline_034206 [Biomphalaria glabrata]|nr:hypothetical protein BgiMline_020393 [Biomphalaria glabrata]
MAKVGKPFKLTVAALADIFVAFLFIVIGVGSKGWFTLPSKFGTDTSTGLSDTSSEPKGQAAYALCVISTLAASTALTAIAIDLITQLLKKKSEKLAKIITLVTLIAAIVGGNFGIIGSIIHAAWLGAFYSDSTISYTPGVSYYLTVVGSLALIIGGGLARRARNGTRIGENSQEIDNQN